MNLEQFRPIEQLVHKKTYIEKPKFPVIDAHNHLAEPFGGGWDNKPIDELLDQLEQAGVTHLVDLDGGWGEDLLNKHLQTIRQKAPEKFTIFGGIQWSEWAVLGDRFPEWAANRIRSQAARGAGGLKVWKDLGLHVRDHHNALVTVDDPRLQPIWDAMSELDLPVMIHVADPVAFFSPIDEQNERIEELGAHPEWSFPSPAFPTFDTILNSLENLIARHPATTFVGAHVGCYAENLGRVGTMLDKYPNYYIDISARIGELGRQPYASRKFIIEHSNRILFGLDMGPNLDGYRLYYRFLETDDEYFNYSTHEIPTQGRWYINGLYLPDEVLEKIYNKNARKLLKLD
jgi:predicted TIM-barrel fold metal-dependent hydrolase